MIMLYICIIVDTCDNDCNSNNSNMTTCIIINTIDDMNIHNDNDNIDDNNNSNNNNNSPAEYDISCSLSYETHLSAGVYHNI